MEDFTCPGLALDDVTDNFGGGHLLFMLRSLLVHSPACNLWYKAEAAESAVDPQGCVGKGVAFWLAGDSRRYEPGLGWGMQWGVQCCCSLVGPPAGTGRAAAHAQTLLSPPLLIKLGGETNRKCVN